MAKFSSGESDNANNTSRPSSINPIVLLVHGIPTIVEANTPLYRWGARVSIYSGLPTVIGWDWHQKQQRSVLPGPMIDERIQDVRNIYTDNDLKETMRLLDQYDVQYVYVGALERIYYGGSGLTKFDQATELWDLVYQNEQVKIYQVLPHAQAP
ncbi:MAG: hypothetical protein ABIU06_19540 [Anaerolineales bacterium]